MSTTDDAPISSVPISSPFGRPRIKPPFDLSVNESGDIAFDLETGKGTVHIKARWDVWICCGSVVALSEAGLLREEWCPGIPGNNKTRQPVFFGASGPVLKIGNKGGPRYKEPHVIVLKSSRNTFLVEIAMTTGQHEQVRPLMETWRAKRQADHEVRKQAAYEKEEEAERNARRKSETQSDIRESKLDLFVMLEGVMSRNMEGRRFRFADEVTEQVEQHVKAIRQLITAGKMVPASLQYQREGNLIRLPERIH